MLIICIVYRFFLNIFPLMQLSYDIIAEMFDPNRSINCRFFCAIRSRVSSNSIYVCSLGSMRCLILFVPIII